MNSTGIKLAVGVPWPFAFYKHNKNLEKEKRNTRGKLVSKDPKQIGVNWMPLKFVLYKIAGDVMEWWGWTTYYVYVSKCGSKNSSGEISVAREPKWDLCLETRRRKCNRASGEPERAPLGAKMASQCMLRCCSGMLTLGLSLLTHSSG